MTQAAIDTTGEESSGTSSKALRVPRHPYLTAAEGCEDLRAVCAMVVETCEELAPVFRSATPPSVQMGAPQAKEGEPFGYIDPTALNRAASQISMLAQQCGLVSSAVQSIAGEMVDQAIDVHVPDAESDE